MLVLPYPSVPQELKQFVEQSEEPVRRLLNGYRNKLSKDLQVVLQSEDNFCGQAFCFKLVDIQSVDQRLSAFQNRFEKLEKVQNNYVLVGKQQIEYFDWDTQSITIQQYNLIVKKLAGSDQYLGMAKNIFLNFFSSLEQVKKSGLAQVLLGSQAQKRGESEPVIKQENQVNNYKGDSIFKVPQFDQNSGKWSKDHGSLLKIKQENTKQTENLKQKLKQQ